MKFNRNFSRLVSIVIILTLTLCLLMYSKVGIHAAGGVFVQYKCGLADNLAQSMRPWFNIYNSSGAAVNLSDLKIRYYYVKEGIPEESLGTFYVSVGPTNVNATFHPELGYAEIGFTSGAGSLADGANTGEIQIALKKSTNGYYDQTNDYSFAPSLTTYGENTKIALFQNGVLVWGTEGPPPPPTPTPPPAGDDWLHTDGSNIRDAAGNIVRLTGINWFGFETGGANGFYGLDKCGVEKSLDLMASRGFNLLRIPVNAEIIKEWSSGTYVKTNFLNTYYNPYLDGCNSLQVLDYTVNYCKRTGMKIMFDMHGASRDSYQENLWYNSTISMTDFVNSWKWLATRFKNDDTVVAMDLKNEPHGKFSGSTISKWDGSSDANNWKKAATDIGNAILAINPNLLIVVEGVEAYPMEGYDYTTCGEFTTYCNWWGSNLRGVAKYPISLATANRLVYSAHDYGPDIYVQPWFKTTFNETTLTNDCWRPNWYYIVEAGTAPVLIGEWGGKLVNSNNSAWFNALANFLSTKNIHHTFWAFNPNSADTGGLMLEDWQTVDETKYNIIKKTLWMKGLDHVVPLGAALNPTATPTGRPVTPTPTVRATSTPTGVVTATPTGIVSPTLIATPTPTQVVTPTPNRRGTPTQARRVTPTRARRVTPTPTTPANTPTPTNRSAGYSVAYVIQSDWGSGATINVTITNNSTAVVNGWTLAFTFPGNQTITNLWNGSYTQSGASVSVKDGGFNANIPAGGGSVNFGFNLNYSGSNAKPTSFTLNGTVCQVQ
ncbi:MAG TPA: cellulase family glycosylhydrolase [Bacillota bacterium]|nr:cellulase family glycosylhydrolase [Bacillota bacterium]